MLKREIAPELLTLVGEYPVVTILGPRQAGKTTLSRMVFPGWEYSNLEVPETREIAKEDPKAYLAGFSGPVIIDEIQRVPHLLSYIQALVDEEGGNGRFVLTGSHQLQLREAIGQSLAGRTAILHLLPLSIAEIRGGGIEFARFEDYCFHGFLPRIHDQRQRPSVAYSNYYQTYVERDVRQLIQLKDASLFEKLMKLLAGRTGQIVDYSSLANDVGVDAKTVRHWMALLEASFVLFKLPPYFENFGKRVIKSPKYYFTDVGLLCYLLGIRAPDQVTRDPLVGAIFENLVVMECVKARLNRGQSADWCFFRDSAGNEVDLILPEANWLRAIEIKSSHTFTGEQLKGLRRMRHLTDRIGPSYLICAGEGRRLSDGVEVLNFRECERVLEEKTVG
jgi:hypothetical protein